MAFQQANQSEATVSVMSLVHHLVRPFALGPHPRLVGDEGNRTPANP